MAKNNQRVPSFGTSIGQLIDHHSKSGWGRPAQQLNCTDVYKLNALALNIINRYISAAIALCKHANKITIDSTCIITISSLWGIKPVIHDFASQVWDRYAVPTVGIKKREKAGLFIPPVKIKKMLVVAAPSTQKISETFYIFLAAIVEKLLFYNIVKTPELQSLPHWLTIK